MNTPSSFDPETFQQLLANAFAVQESQISARCLADIMAVQRSVESGKLDLEGAMRGIVESARNVANAAGVSIALLNGDHLTYRAASGASAASIGLQVTASLTVSPDTRANREILRVENAQTDTRIEADICRQFGASSLLILPIYRGRALAGILDVRFSEAHAFQEREVRTYRLMAEQIEAALFHAAQPEPKENLVPALPLVPEIFEQILLPDENFAPPPDENFVLPPEFIMLPQNEHSLYARCGAVLADIMELPGFKQSAVLATIFTQRTKSIHWPNRRRNTAAAKESALFKRPVSLATTFAQRANLTWPSRRRNSARDGADELSLAFRRSALHAITFAQRAKNLTWRNRSRNWSTAAASELSSAFRRSALHPIRLARRANKMLSWAARCRDSSITARRELRSSSVAASRKLSSLFQRSAWRAALLARRAKNVARLGQQRGLVLASVAVLLAFIAFIAYRSPGPAKSMESSTLPSSTTIDHPLHLPKPRPGKGAAAAQPLPAASNAAMPARTALKRVRVGQNEVDYVAEDVTMRVFTNKPAARRKRPQDGRVAQYGNDVTVRYFTPPQTSTRSASR